MAYDYRYEEAKKLLKEQKYLLKGGKLLASINPGLAEEFIKKVYAIVPDNNLVSPKYNVFEREIFANTILAVLFEQIIRGRSWEAVGRYIGKEKEAKPEPGEEGISPAPTTQTKSPFGEIPKGPFGGQIPPTQFKEDYYDALGVDSAASIEEITSAYRRKAFELHPDTRNKNLTPEQNYELDEKLLKANDAYRILGNEKSRKNYDEWLKLTKITKPVSVKERVSFPFPTAGIKSGINNIIIKLIPKTKIKQNKKALDFSKQVDSAGYINFSHQEIEDLKIRMKAKGVLNTPDIKEGEINTALQLYSKGVSGKNLEAKADQSMHLSHEQKQSLYRTALIMSFLSAANPSLTSALETSYGQPDIEISATPPSYTPTPNQLSLSFQDGGFLPDILKQKAQEFIDVKLEPVKQRVKDFTLNAIKKGSDKFFKELSLFGKKALEKGAQKVAQTGVALLAKAGVTLTAEAAAGVATGGIGLVIAAAWEVLKRVYNVFKKVALAIGRFFTGEKDFRKQLFVIAGTATMILFGLGQFGAATISGAITLGSGAALITGRQIVGSIRGVFESLGVFVTAVLLPSIAIPFTIAFIALPLSIALIVFIINSGAYIVPKGGFGSRMAPPSDIPPGGIVEHCDPQKTGVEITRLLSQRITAGIVRLLPPTNGAMAQSYCITPTMIILHSSGGYDNDLGNDRTYETLVRNNVACQLATDTNDTYLMQHFYQNQVQYAWCANAWNTYGISIEIAGECQDGKGPCARNYSACQVGSDSYPYIFSYPPPHPCAREPELVIDALCEVMNQYKIPWTQVFTHDDVPGAIHTDPIGKDFVYRYIIPRLRSRCPNV